MGGGDQGGERESSSSDGGNNYRRDMDAVDVAASAEDLVLDGDRSRHSVRQPSLGNPTREYLQGVTKCELQKHCRMLGLGSVWVPKDKLIDMIMEYTESTTSVGATQHANMDEISVSELRKFKDFVNETNARFDSINSNLLEKDKEIDELKNRVLVAEGRIQTLLSKIELCEAAHCNMNDIQPTRDDRILLLGDACLTQVKSSDLDERCMVRTVPGANMDLMKSWVTDKLDYSLKECIVYCGAQDVLESNSRIEKILDDLGDLITELRNKNEDITVRVCELVPNLMSNEAQAKTEAFNLKLTDWCAKNGISLISTELYFRLGMGDADANCYVASDDEGTLSSDLTRTGAIRLLEAIANKCENKILCAQWKQVKQNAIRNKYDNNLRKDIPSNRNVGRPWVRDQSSEDTNVVTVNYGRNHSKSNVRFNETDHHYHSNDRYQHVHEFGESRWRGGGRRRSDAHFSPGLQRGSSNTYHDRDRQPRAGCFNCGEFNHQHNKCRFDHKLRCGNCKSFGHKSKLCHFYSSEH